MQPSPTDAIRFVEDRLNGIRIGLFRSAPDGRILEANEALAEILGYDGPHELHDVNAEELYVNAAARREWRALVDRDGVVQDFDIQVRRRDGSTRWVRSSVRGVRDDGRLLHYEGSIQDVTAWKEAEERRAQTTALLEMGERMAHVGTWELDLRTAALRWSDELFRIFGLEPRSIEPTYEDLVSRIHPHDRELISRTLAEGIKAAIPFSYEGRIVRPDGSIRHLRGQNDVILDQGGRPERGFGIVQDITEWRIAEQEINTRGRQQAAVAEVLGMALAGAPFTSLLDRAAEVIAHALDLPRTKIFELLPGGQELCLLAGYGWQEGCVGAMTVGSGRRSQAGYTLEVGGPVVSDLRSERRFTHDANPAERGVMTSATVIMQAAGEVYGVLGADSLTAREFSAIDIDFLQTIADVLAGSFRRLQSDQALRRSEERFRTLFERVPVGVYRSTPDGRVLDGNPALAEMLGFDSVEALRSTLSTDHYVDPADRLRWRSILEGTGVLDGYEMRQRRPDGTVIWVRDTARVIRDDQGNVLYYEGILQDITEERRATEALRTTNDALATLISSSPIPIITLDRDGVVTEWNPAADQTFGWTADEVIGRPYPLVPPYEVERFTSFFQEILSGQSFTDADARRRHKDGRILDVSSSGAPLRDASGAIIGALLILVDITDRRKAEEELRQSLQLLRAADDHRRGLMARLATAQEEERRRIAADIHDDSIQVMTAAGMRLATLRRRADEEQANAIATVEETVRHSIARLRHLMFELRPPALDRDGLAAALKLYVEPAGDVEHGPALSITDRFSTQPPLESRTVLYRIAQEALMNIRKHARATRVEINLAERDGGHAVTIRDNGAGFAPDRKPSPTHLGLTAMRERAQMAGGTLHVSSEEGVGTTVEAWIPAVASAGSDEPSPR